MFITRVNKKLDEERDVLKASSCTFYIRDPHWTDQFRLVAMSGVHIKEPMYGFVMPYSSRRIVAEGELKIFSTDVCNDERFHVPQVFLRDIPEDRQALFGDFVQRENVQSAARLIQTNSDGQQEAILFMNFSKKIEFTESIQSEICSFFQSLIAELSTIKRALIKLDAKWLSEATQIVSPAWSIANTDFHSLDEPGGYFEKIIKLALTVLDVNPEEGLGTLHLYNPEERTLELRGSFGQIQHKEVAKLHSVKAGQGIVSWVVQRKRALLIQDLKESSFQRIHRWLNDEVRSELAVPLDVGGEVIGVMCLECTKANKFLPHHVRSLWYAANKAAVAYQLYKQASMNRKLINLFWNATRGETEAQNSLHDIATLAQKYLKASFCDIWQYNPDSDRFDNSGASYENFSPQTRPDGWTTIVQRSKCPIWISNIKSVSEFDEYYWKDDQWFEGTPDNEVKKDLNAAPIGQDVKGELGIPITVRHDDCIGVAWIKYRRAGLQLPSQNLVKSAEGFCSGAGLVLDSVQRKHDLLEKSDIDYFGSQIAEGIKSRWQLENCTILDVHVESLPYHSELGGDFYAGKSIDDQTVGILLVDGEGHGVKGSLHMLPLMTAFESSWQSYSTTHIISQLKKTSREVGVRGTAIYCIFTLIDSNMWLSVTSAGHERLIIVKRDQFNMKHLIRYPEIQGSIFSDPLKEPFLADRLKLSTGDIVVGFTDGVIEFGEVDSLCTFVWDFLNKIGDDPKAIAEGIMKWSQEEYDKDDDATVFIVRVK